MVVLTWRAGKSCCLDGKEAEEAPCGTTGNYYDTGLVGNGCDEVLLRDYGAGKDE